MDKRFFYVVYTWGEMRYKGSVMVTTYGGAYINEATLHTLLNLSGNEGIIVDNIIEMSEKDHNCFLEK